MLPEDFHEKLSELALTLSMTQVNQVLAYAALLRKWNTHYNLISRPSVKNLETHHLLDSLTLLPVLDDYARQDPQRVVDIGTGAGLPGVLIAIAKPAWQIICMDAVEKKIAFIRQVKAMLGLTELQARHIRIAEGVALTRGSIVVSRAMTALDALANLAAHCVLPEGYLLAMVGKAPRADDLAAVSADWKWCETRVLQVPGLTAVERHAVVWQYQGKLT